MQKFSSGRRNHVEGCLGNNLFSTNDKRDGGASRGFGAIAIEGIFDVLSDGGSHDGCVCLNLIPRIRVKYPRSRYDVMGVYVQAENVCRAANDNTPHDVPLITLISPRVGVCGCGGIVLPSHQ